MSNRGSEPFRVAVRELELNGIKAEISVGGGGHYRIEWLGRAGRRCVVFLSRTASDWRGAMNARADVRRKLRQDGVL